jgi:hypothetical protein
MTKRWMWAPVVAGWIGACAVACGSSSTTSGDPYDGGASSSSSNGSNGGNFACTMAAAGHTSGNPIQPRALFSTANEPFGGPRTCTLSDTIFDTPAAYDAYLASKTDGGAGPDAGGAVDWSKEVVFLHAALSNTSLDLVGIDGDAIVVVTGSVCQGVAPYCIETAYAVPTAKRIAGATCPRPDSGPCLAP